MDWTLLAAGAALLLLGCPGDGPETPAPARQSAGENGGPIVVLRLDREAELDGLRLIWRELADSRCPIGVTCVWEGEAVATIEAARGEGAGERVELTLRPGAQPATATAAGAELRLLSVEPYPRDGVVTARGEYRARLEVRGL